MENERERESFTLKPFEEPVMVAYTKEIANREREDGNSE